MNILTDIRMKRSKLVLQNNEAIPVNPELYEITTINGIFHLYSMIDNQPMWYPLTNKRVHYTHTQIEMNDVWTISHNLGTVDIIVNVFDSSNNIIMVTPEIVSTEQIILRFAEPVSGKAIIFGTSPKAAGFSSCDGAGEVKESISYGTEDPDSLVESALYFQIES